MELTELLNHIKTIQVIGEVQRKDISGIEYDSRKVINNSLFAAIKGYNTDGHKYILEAISKGAKAVILEDNEVLPDSIFLGQKIAKILVKNSRVALAEAAGAFYRKPSEKLKLIGITGTNGKTTTSYYLKSIIDTAGSRTGLIGTITNLIGEREVKSLLTTPEANDLNAILYEMHSSNCDYSVMEVSSHSLVLNRVYGLNFAGAVFTNITSDHLDFHENFENYFNAKKMLFDSLPKKSFCLYNADDKYGKAITADTSANKYAYGISADDIDFKISGIDYNLEGTSFTIRFREKDYYASTSLVGEFNAYNACAAFAAAVLSGIDENTAVEGIKNTPQVPGRFEVIGNGNKKVIIDYSHTEDSLEKALKAIRQIVKNERPVYTVFGCGGNRDKTKRPLMGKTASELSDFVIITSDNPRNEDPFNIIDSIKEGILKDNYRIIENREEAIKSAIEMSRDDAVILVAGKGHESYQEIKGVRTHFSDKETADKYLNK
jgi:UDP-N-acetylmuramoyl-L-alanyl-D-glutamate--2,6-diaminopimelate ligase